MDPGTAIGIANMVCSASKALCQYVKAFKDYEKDAGKVQKQLDWLYNLFRAAENALRQDSTSESNRTLLRDALLDCRGDALQLSHLVDRFS